MPAVRLPIFPLSVVLFPGTPLPLHIFEPRYRRMLADCLAADRKFGITPPGAERETPDPGAVGCIAEVRVNQELPDGRSNIVVLGGSRFVVRRELSESVPYHVAAVELFDDEETWKIGVEDAGVPTVMNILQRSCRRRTQIAVPYSPALEPGLLYMPENFEVEVGGAIVFVLDVERFERI